MHANNTYRIGFNNTGFEAKSFAEKIGVIENKYDDYSY